MPAEAAGAPGQELQTAAGRPANLMLVLSSDPTVRRRLGLLAAESGLTFADAAGTPEAGMPAAGDDAGAEPAVAVLDLNWPGALDLVRAWRSHWPAALLAGYLTVPDRERWVAAQRAGCDLVANRGALVLRLREALARSEAPGAHAFPLFDAADAAGRLGLVFRAADTPAGPVAVYRVDGQLRAVADRCPHAGAALSEGEVEAGVLTCPGHGSRFDIRTGERLRGPADTGIAVFQVAESGGQICLLVRG